MEADDLLCSRNARSSLDSARDPEPVEGRTPLAGANGTSRRACGGAGEKVTRKGRSISPHPQRENERAWRGYLKARATERNH